MWIFPKWRKKTVMSGFNFGDLAQALSETKLSGVSFLGQAKNWGTAAEGNVKKHQHCCV